MDRSAETVAPPDRIFVRNLVLPARIGIFPHERERLQDVRVCVSAEVPPPETEPGSIEDTLSYDLIIAAVRRLVAAGHIDLVETLAERIAGAVLRLPGVVAVTVRVEKLEIVPGGSVGVEILRRAARPSGEEAPEMLGGNTARRETLR